MLDKYGDQIRGAAVGVVVIALCLVFILQFGGPQADGCARMESGSRWAAEVDGNSISEGDYRAAYALAGGDRQPTEVARRYKLKELVMDGLVERELLAHQAERMGFHVTEDEAMRRLVEDGAIYMSSPAGAPQGLFPPNPTRGAFRNEQGAFDLEYARNFIRNQLRRSVAEFASGQVREILAQNVRDAVTSNVTVSPNEVWDTFVREREKVTLQYVRFSPVYYRDTLSATPAEIQTWASAHASEVDAEFQRQRHQYTNLEKQVRARHILIKVEEGASDEAKTAARARIDALLVRARAGEDFAALARDNSEDTGSARRGGDLGYNPRGRMVAAFDQAQFALTPGQISDVVQTNFGFHVIKVEGVREGDVPEAEAKAEVAENLYRQARSNELAKQAAEQALRDVRGGMSMADLDTRLHPPPPAPPPPADGSTPPPPPPADDEAGDPLAPRVRTTNPFGRTDSPIPGPFDSAGLARVAFDLTAQNPLPTEPMKLGEEWVIYRLESRDDPRREDFSAEEQSRITDGLLAAKRREVLSVYVRQLRTAAEHEGRVRVNDEVLRYAEEGSEESASN